MKPGNNRDELCYSFIYDTSWVCDFEVATNELCNQIGSIHTALVKDAAMADIAADLDRLQPLAFHLNGSIRGRMAIEEADVQWLQARLDHYRDAIQGRVAGFVLPRGEAPVPTLYAAVTSAKQAIRHMVRIEQEGREIPPLLPRIANLMGNFFFVLAQTVNHRRGVVEVPFESKSYTIRAPKSRQAEFVTP
jgi:ATP:cob(I)alamin adenosyltransferase